MRVLVDVRHLSDRHKTGVGEYTSALLRALSDLGGADYEPISTGWRAKPTDGARTTHVGAPNKLLKLSTYAAGRPRLDRLASAPPDLAWMPNLNFAAFSPSVPYALTIHDLSWRIFPEYFSWRMRLWHRGTRPDRLAANAAAIIVPSRATKEDVIRFFKKPPETVHVIPHGVDPMFSPAFEPRDHGVRGRHRLPARFALFVGTLEPRKNVAALVDAVEAYRQGSGDDLHLVLVGGWGWKSGSIDKRLKDAAGETARRSPHGLKPNASRPPPWIHPLGYVPRADLPAIYRAADVFVWPSAYEGFGLPVLEAMASGTPVITSHTSSLPELVGGAAVLVNPFRTEDTVQALVQLLSSAPLRSRLARAGLERARQYSWPRAAKETLAVFESMIG
jgi:glycosyltransferase involved in cell wall biosynthesis